MAVRGKVGVQALEIFGLRSFTLRAEYCHRRRLMRRHRNREESIVEKLEEIVEEKTVSFLRRRRSSLLLYIRPDLQSAEDYSVYR